ncbi:MAG: DEAD/DEAH box helicase [Gemmatimonadaceae bacterium]|nr:DEAD/DEAH box helicase [Gemmatimonadaceae bacterium]
MTDPREPWSALGAALDVATPPDETLGDAPADAPRQMLGRVVLAPHQRDAVAALQRVLDAHGVALLADATGLGKTYAALGVAARRGGAHVIAPAAVVEAWREAAARADVGVTVHSTEHLSRRSVSPTTHPLVILDEAHGFRTATTRRWRHAARLCRGRPLLLCSATPIHNARADVVTILRLALGARAATWTDAQIQSITVRRTADELDASVALPRVHPWLWWAVPDDAGVAAAIETLPPALPVVDIQAPNRADALWRFGLLRAWASSAAALRTALIRRLSMADAMCALLLDGRRPTPATLRRWVGADATVQPELPFADPAVDAGWGLGPATVASLLPIVTRHADALRTLLHSGLDDRGDAHRCARVWAWVQQSEAPTLLFTHATATAAMYWRGLRQHAGVALLTATGGRIASGAIPRAELLRWLDPARVGATARDPTRVLRLVIATDLASEGVNLHRAAQIVHADLPWTPARIAQRIGRVARLGAEHPHVAVAAFAPPASGNATLQLDSRLDRKRADAVRVLGDERIAALRRRLRHPPAAEPQVVQGTPVYLLGAVGGARPGACVAVIRDRDGVQAYGESAEGLPRWAPLTAQQVAERLGVGDPPIASALRGLQARDRRRLARRILALRRTLSDDEATSALTGGFAPVPPRWLAHAERALREAPRHQRVAAHTLLQEFRARLTAPLPAHIEAVLGKAVQSRARGVAWLARVVRIVRAAPVPPAAASASPRGTREVVAVWVVEAEAAGGG